jgi:hypothetical protein
MGWVADDVLPVAPELVDHDPSGYKAVAYGRASVLVAEAVKELAEEVSTTLTLTLLYPYPLSGYGALYVWGYYDLTLTLTHFQVRSLRRRVERMEAQMAH